MRQRNTNFHNIRKFCFTIYYHVYNSIFKPAGFIYVPGEDIYREQETLRLRFTQTEECYIWGRYILEGKRCHVFVSCCLSDLVLARAERLESNKRLLRLTAVNRMNDLITFVTVRSDVSKRTT